MVTAKRKKAALGAAESDIAALTVNVYDGTRDPLSDTIKVLIRIRDGGQKEIFNVFRKAPSRTFQVPFYDNLNDRYTVLVSCDGYRDAGFFPVKVSQTLPQTVNLMLVPRNADFKFLEWDTLKQKYPAISTFLSCGLTAGEAKAKYVALRRDKPAALSSLLNLTAAMSTIYLPEKTPLDYFKEILWDESLAQDRFFGYADSKLVDQVRLSAAQGAFEAEPNPGLFHPDATSSFKQVHFGEANVQLTFHEGARKTVDGVKCIKVEPDIDYYRDPGAHALLEVLPNTVLHRLTDPKTVYVLRWIAGKQAQIPEFDPAYTLA